MNYIFSKNKKVSIAKNGYGVTFRCPNITDDDVKRGTMKGIRTEVLDAEYFVKYLGYKVRISKKGKKCRLDSLSYAEVSEIFNDYIIAYNDYFEQLKLINEKISQDKVTPDEKLRWSIAREAGIFKGKINGIQEAVLFYLMNEDKKEKVEEINSSLKVIANMIKEKSMTDMLIADKYEMYEDIQRQEAVEIIT